MRISLVMASSVADIQPVVYSPAPRRVPQIVIEKDVSPMEISPEVQEILDSNKSYLQKVTEVNKIVNDMDKTTRMLSLNN